ncbi:hypothetical protein EMIT0P265_180004 [Pseudomonas zeae]
MFSPANKPHFTLTLAGADFQVLFFEGRDALNTPFEFELELVNERAFLNLESLLHQLAFLQFAPNGSGIHGLVYGIAQGEAGKRLPLQCDCQKIRTWQRCVDEQPAIQSVGNNVNR